MMMGMEGCSMGWMMAGMGLAGLLLVTVLVLGIVALVGYLNPRGRGGQGE